MTDPSLEKKFKQRKSALLEKAQAIRKDLSKSVDADFAEQVTERENDEVLEGLLAETNAEIQTIDRALKRLEKGTYGLCTLCGEAINGERLSILPGADHCIKCASQSDRRV
ncbi:MAG TPA: hypothetical protein DCZ03_10245 [Gammaproteobacteria bacterium]|nr:hypothetical protein [Gammaproteobacteria bacterium]